MDVDSGRVEVALDEGGEVVLLRPANATLAETVGSSS